MPASEAAAEADGAVKVGTGGPIRVGRMREAAVAVVATLRRPPRSAACSSEDCDGTGAASGVNDDADAPDVERVSRLGNGRRGRPAVEAVVPETDEILESAGGGVAGRDVVTRPWTCSAEQKNGSARPH